MENNKKTYKKHKDKIEVDEKAHMSLGKKVDGKEEAHTSLTIFIYLVVAKEQVWCQGEGQMNRKTYNTI